MPQFELILPLLYPTDHPDPASDMTAVGTRQVESSSVWPCHSPHSQQPVASPPQTYLASLQPTEINANLTSINTN